MLHDFLLPLVAFAFVSSITPGPNNLMLMASGANYGLRRTVPHALGVALGFIALLVPVGIGLVGLFEAVPLTYTLLQVVCVAYLLFLAWRIATAAAPDGAGSTGRPITFLEAVVFQWVNPKAWFMALTAVTVYAPDRSVWAILVTGVVFGAVNLPSVWSWAWLGVQMRRILSSSRRLRAFNILMAVLLVGSLYPFFVSS